jgi:hypothetical protein
MTFISSFEITSYITLFACHVMSCLFIPFLSAPVFSMGFRARNLQCNFPPWWTPAANNLAGRPNSWRFQNAICTELKPPIPHLCRDLLIFRFVRSASKTEKSVPGLVRRSLPPRSYPPMIIVHFCLNSEQENYRSVLHDTLSGSSRAEGRVIFNRKRSKTSL